MKHGSGSPIFEVRNLKKHYPITGGFLKGEIGRVRAVDGISFELERGETLGIVGESGCGKSTAATSMIRLEEPTDGDIIYKGENVTEFDSQQLKRWRREVQMIFQDPDSSFNPRMNIGDAVAEPLIVQGMSDKQRRDEIVADLLERVGLSADAMKRYPHEFSGGQKQRISLARVLSVNPEIIVADEPVSALDVSIQSEVLKLMKHLQDEFNLTIVVISHNLGAIREICDRVAVMYLGEFVEVGPTEELFNNPKHPYTRALLSAIPTPDPNDRGLGIELKGDVPDPSAPPSGCRFHTRCPEVIQPDEFDLDQDNWRHLLHFRQRIRDGRFDTDSLADVAIVEGDVDEQSDKKTSITDVPESEVKSIVRREYELPETFEDPKADEIVEKVLSHIADDEIELAREELNEWFVTPCELDHPELEQVDINHEAACLLLDDHVDTSVDNLREVYANQQSHPSD